VCLTGRSTQKLLGNGHVEGIRFEDGEELPPTWLSWPPESGRIPTWDARLVLTVNRGNRRQ